MTGDPSKPDVRDLPSQFTREPAEGGRDAGSTGEDTEAERIQRKQGGHHLPPHAGENPLDDTDRNSDKVIKPSQRKP